MTRIIASGVALSLIALSAWSEAASAQDGPVMKRIAETKTINIGHRDASVPICSTCAAGTPSVGRRL